MSRNGFMMLKVIEDEINIYLKTLNIYLKTLNIPCRRYERIPYVQHLQCKDIERPNDINI